MSSIQDWQSVVHMTAMMDNLVPILHSVETDRMASIQMLYYNLRNFFHAINWKSLKVCSSSNTFVAYFVLNALQIVDLYTKINPETIWKKLKKKTIKEDQLSETGREFKRRLQENFDRYFSLNSYDKDISLLALHLDPLTMTMRKYCRITDTERKDIERGGDLLRLLFSEHTKVMAQKLSKETSVSSSIEESKQAEKDKNDDDEEAENGMWDHPWGRTSDSSCDSMISDESHHSDTATPLVRAKMSLAKEMDDWMNLKIDWLSLYPDLHRKRTKNVFYMSKNIDPLDWWRNSENQARFPTIFNFACRILALPAANGFQERVFSRSRYIDTYLRQNLSERKFECLTLLAFNQEFLEEYVPFDTETMDAYEISKCKASLNSVNSKSKLIEYFVNKLKQDSEGETVSL